MKFQWVSWSWLLDNQREWDPAVGEWSKWKELSVWFYSLFPPLIFRICRGRVAAIPGTPTAVTPTTASQTPETSPAQWWSSGSKLDIQVCLDHKDCSSVKKKIKLHKKIRVPVVHKGHSASLVWPFGSEVQVLYYLTHRSIRGIVR